MIPLLLIGGGGHCRSCIEVIESQKEYKIAGIVLPDTGNPEPILGYPVLGIDEELEKLLLKIPYAIVTVGQIRNPDIRIRLFEKLKKNDAKLPIIIASTAYCSQHALVGYGSIVMHGAQVNTSARIGENCIINSQALVEHDVHIDHHCHIATGARINGGAQIGMGSFVGSGSIIREGVKVGSRVIIGTGQVILRDVPEGKVVK